MKSKILGLLALGLLGGSMSAQASLIGDQIRAQWFFPSLATPVADDTFTVGASVEINCPGTSSFCPNFNAPTATIDFGASSIRYDHPVIPSGFNAATFNGWVFSDLDLGSAIIGFDLGTNIVGLTTARVSFTADSITINMQGLAGNTTDRFVQIDLLTATVPEPGTLALLGLGLAGLAAARRRKQ